MKDAVCESGSQAPTTCHMPAGQPYNLQFRVMRVFTFDALDFHNMTSVLRRFLCVHRYGCDVCAWRSEPALDVYRISM